MCSPRFMQFDVTKKVKNICMETIATDAFPHALLRYYRFESFPSILALIVP